MTRGATQELIGPSCEIITSKLKYFNLGRKLHRSKRGAVNASPTLLRPKHPKRAAWKNVSHARLYVHFSWDSVARKNRVAFGVNAP